MLRAAIAFFLVVACSGQPLDYLTNQLTVPFAVYESHAAHMNAEAFVSVPDLPTGQNQVSLPLLPFFQNLYTSHNQAGGTAEVEGAGVMSFTPGAIGTVQTPEGSASKHFSWDFNLEGNANISASGWIPDVNSPSAFGTVLLALNVYSDEGGTFTPRLQIYESTGNIQGPLIQVYTGNGPNLYRGSDKPIILESDHRYTITLQIIGYPPEFDGRSGSSQFHFHFKGTFARLPAIQPENLPTIVWPFGSGAILERSLDLQTWTQVPAGTITPNLNGFSSFTMNPAAPAEFYRLKLP